jgi:hypothetical protein
MRGVVRGLLPDQVARQVEHLQLCQGLQPRDATDPTGGHLKGVGHEIFRVLFWHVWIDLGLYKCFG